jgi:hypothetical protein
MAVPFIALNLGADFDVKETLDDGGDGLFFIQSPGQGLPWQKESPQSGPWGLSAV